MTEKLTLYGSVISDAERLFEITAEQLHWRKRYPHIVRARQWVWMVLHDAHHWSYPEIGRAMGFDHTTVILGARKARKWSAANTQTLPILSPTRATLPRWSSCAAAPRAATSGGCSMPPEMPPSGCSSTEGISVSHEALANAGPQVADAPNRYEAEQAGEALAI